MTKLIALLLIAHLSLVSLIAQQTGTTQTPRTVIQTPFGPVVREEPPTQGQAPAPAAAQPQVPVPGTPPPAPAVVPADAQPAGQPGQVADELSPVLLNMDNADIYQVIRIILNALNLNYIIDPSVRGTVNINTAGTLRRSDLLPILETILKINGATLIQTGNFYQVIPATAATRQPLAVQERTDAAFPDDQMVMQIIRMKFVSASEMSRLLTPYVSEGGNIVVHDVGNILLITERRSNLRKLLEVVDIFDTNAFEGERVRMLPVANNLARDLIPDLRSIFAGYALSESATAIRFVPFDRLNSILVITPNPAVFPEVEKWLERLDQPAANAGVRNFVYKVRNAKAVELQRVMSELYGSRVQIATPAVTQLPPGAAPPTPPIPPAIPLSQPQAAEPGTTIVQSGTLKIIADEINNALVIQTTPQVYSDVERTLQELDVLPRQVLVDAQIYEVVLDDSISLGLSAILQNRGTLANPQTTASFVTPPGGTPSLAAQTFAFIGRSRELLVFLNASENRSRVRTLSAPSVLVKDNMTADFQVGQEVPIPNSSSVTPVQSGGTNLFAQTILYRPTGVILRVRPQINESGNVTMEIYKEVSQAGTNTTSAVVAPVIGKSSVASTVVVQDGQTIALSGFMRESNDLFRNRIPLLGRIPGLGILFGNTQTRALRTELIVLITPHVLRTHEEADLATDELKAKLRELQKLLN
jgi:general secretion pathway protein D